MGKNIWCTCFDFNVYFVVWMTYNYWANCINRLDQILFGGRPYAPEAHDQYQYGHYRPYCQTHQTPQEEKATKEKEEKLPKFYQQTTCKADKYEKMNPKINRHHSFSEYLSADKQGSYKFYNLNQEYRDIPQSEVYRKFRQSESGFQRSKTPIPDHFEHDIPRPHLTTATFLQRSRNGSSRVYSPVSMSDNPNLGIPRNESEQVTPRLYRTRNEPENVMPRIYKTKQETENATPRLYRAKYQSPQFRTTGVQRQPSGSGSEFFPETMFPTSFHSARPNLHAFRPQNLQRQDGREPTVRRPPPCPQHGFTVRT